MGKQDKGLIEVLGGRTTISPPSNVESGTNDYKIIASGIDKVVLAIDVEWISEAFFIDLSELKSKAKLENSEQPFNMKLFAEENTDWKAVIKPHGSNGYEWLLIGKDFTFRIGNWRIPTTRPSMMAEINSETLWRLGPERAVETIARLIKGYGGRIVGIKPSRIDLCTDMLLPTREWTQSIIEGISTRAVYAAIHYDLKRKGMQGVSIGKGVVTARIYDKELEIQQQSKKAWMYDIWGVDTIPIGFKAIRVEFQLRREAIKDLGINYIDDFFKYIENLWSYCTEKWLSFRDNPGKHHSLRSTLLWWQSVQNGFRGLQNAMPLIRCKALKADEQQLFGQAYGMISSMRALSEEKSLKSQKMSHTFFGALIKFREMARIYGKDDDTFQKDIEEKRYKYQRIRDKFKIAETLRALISRPVGIQFAGENAWNC